MNITIKDIHDFHEFLKTDYNSGKHDALYRGVNSIEHKLIPVIGRCTKNDVPLTITDEKTMLRLFQQKAYPHYYKIASFSKINLDLISLARHHGLPTRLLDWSWNPLVAFYFAVRRASEKDSLVYVWKNKIKVRIYDSFDPFKIDKVHVFIPKHLTPRITSQDAVFSVSPRPYEEFNGPSIHKIIIKNDFRQGLKHILHELGINESSMFPDLDGVAKYIEYLKTDNQFIK